MFADWQLRTHGRRRALKDSGVGAHAACGLGIEKDTMSDLGAAQQRWTPAVTMGPPHLGDIGLLTDTTHRRGPR